MYADSRTEAEIFAAVDSFFAHIANRRVEETLRAFVPDADAALYGSEKGEAAIGPAALREFFETLFRSGAGPLFALATRRASIAGDAAWFTAEARVETADGRSLPYRLTGILVRRDGRWLWALFSGSEPR